MTTPKSLTELLREFEPDYKAVSESSGHVHVRVVDRASFEKLKQVAIELANGLQLSPCVGNGNVHTESCNKCATISRAKDIIGAAEL